MLQAKRVEPLVDYELISQPDQFHQNICNFMFFLFIFVLSQTIVGKI
jgi:hypothetical protein